MSLSVRREALNFLDGMIEQSGQIPISKSGAKKSVDRLTIAREEYERARLEFLIHDYPRFYRHAIYGTARPLPDDDPEFKFVVELSRALVESQGRKIDIITGGGPGIMRAGNLGVHLARETQQDLGAKSLGLPLTSLGHQEKPNMHLDFQYPHRDFHPRLQEFEDRTKSSYLAQGGIGTLDEKMNTMQALQVGHLEPNYLMIAHPYWEPVLEAFYKAALIDREENGKIPLVSPKDTGLIKISDKIPDIVDAVNKNYDLWYQKYGQFVAKKP